MNDYTYTDFLIKKSVQPYSLRNIHGGVNQNQNLTLHLNKKAAQLRQEGGQQMNTKQIIESKKLQVLSLPDTDRHLKQITHPKEINWRDFLKDEDHQKMVNLMFQDQYTDDVIVVSQGSKVNSKNYTSYQKQLEKLKKQKRIWTIENKLKFVMADKVNFSKIMNMHKQFVTEKVKRNFRELKGNSELSPQGLHNDQNRLDEFESNQAYSTAEYFKLLREKSKEMSKINTQSQNMNFKELQSQDGSPINSQYSTSRVTFFDAFEKMNSNSKQQKKDSLNTSNDNLQNQSSTRQNQIEQQRNSITVKLLSNQSSPQNSQKIQNEMNNEQKNNQKIPTQYSKPDQINEQSKNQIQNHSTNMKKQDSIHAHFEDESDKHESRKNSEKYLDKSTTSKIESKLSFGYHENTHTTLMNINPFESDIFFTNTELETEKKWKNVNPGEKYEQLRLINEDKEKKLIEFICKKNKFQLVDLFPNNVKNKKYRYLFDDNIQLQDFDKTLYLKKLKEQEMERKALELEQQRKSSFSDSRKSLRKKSSSKTEQTTPRSEVLSFKSNIQVPQEDQIIEQFPFETSPQKNRKLSKRKIKSQCIQRLSKQADLNSVNYLRIYGLEETTNLKDEFSKFRNQVTGVTSSSQRTIQNKNSFYSNEEDIPKIPFSQSSSRNEPYLFKSSSQFYKNYRANSSQNLLSIDFNQDPLKFNSKNQDQILNILNTNTVNSEQKIKDVKGKDQLVIQIRPQKNTSQNQSTYFKISSDESTKFQSLNLQTHEKEQSKNQLTHQDSLNSLLSPLKKSLKEINKAAYTIKDQLSQSAQFNVKQMGQSSTQLNVQQNSKSFLNTSKSVQRLNEKQESMKDNFQLKEDFINFYDNMIKTSKKQTSQSTILNKKINRMVNRVDKKLSEIQSSEGPKLSTLSHEFRDFKEMKIFKRKLFNFAVNKIHPDDRKSLFELYSMTHPKEVEQIFQNQMQK